MTQEALALRPGPRCLRCGSNSLAEQAVLPMRSVILQHLQYSIKNEYHTRYAPHWRATLSFTRSRIEQDLG